MSGAGQLEGRTALITGASQGMGRVIAKRFAREGAKVVLVARSRERLAETAEEIEAAGGRALVAPTDVGDAAEVDALAQRVEAEVGPLDAVGQNSGIAGPTAELWKVAPEAWEEDDPRQTSQERSCCAGRYCARWWRGGREASS